MNSVSPGTASKRPAAQSSAAGCGSRDFFGCCWSDTPPPGNGSLFGFDAANGFTLVIRNPRAASAPVSFVAATGDANSSMGPVAVFVDGLHQGSSVLHVTKGQLSTTGDTDLGNLVVGDGGHGQFNQSGGEVSLFIAIVGMVNGVTGAYNLTGG